MTVTGKVVKGDGYGRTLGFPTANIDRRQFAKLSKKPKLGVWAGTVKIISNSYELKAKSYPAGIVIGPQDKKGLPKLEAYLIGYTGNLYGKKLEFMLLKYLRPFQVYTGVADLKKQIKADVSKIKKLKF